MSFEYKDELVLPERSTPLILLVDDDAVIRSMMKKVLDQQGYEVIESSNGAEGVELFESDHPDLVLLDVVMPVMNGYEACEQMRKRDPEISVPIIMLTGMADPESIDRAFLAGSTDFITKPINWSLFNQRLRYALRARKNDYLLHRNEQRIRHVLEVAKLGYWDWNLKSDKFVVSNNFLQMLGVASSDLNGIDSFIDLVPDEDKDKVQHAFSQLRLNGQAFSLEHKIKTAEQIERHVYQHCEVIEEKHKKTELVLGVIQDVTAIKHAEEIVLHQAYHDSLTDLPNQTLFKERLNHAIMVAKHSKNNIAVILMNIDRFQLINESIGHDSGDEVLLAFAGFLQGFIHEGDTVSRIMGNEFAIFLETATSVDEITSLVRDIRMSLNSNSFDFSNEQIYLSLSLGVALYPDDSLDAETLIQQANSAMRKAKSSGGDQECFYTSNMNRRVHDRLRMESDFRQAFEQHQLELYYQPQIEVSTKNIVSMEALVRWNHPEHGLISPARFIPMAEESGLIQVLGHFVLDNAMRQTKIWHNKGHMIRVGINLSARQFKQKNLVEQIGQLLNKHQLEAKYVDLEITESIAMQNAEACTKKMHQLKTLGVSLSMDDFGTGYSSLSYLNKFPLNVLKIDRSFIQDIENNGARVLAIIAMAKSLSLDVIAEGVETEEQYEFLKKNNCDFIQGYLFSKPLTESEFEKILL